MTSLVPGTRRKKRILSLVGVLVIIGTLVYMFYGGIGSNLVYFLTPGELLARGEKAFDRPVRLGGQVEPGSVEWNAEALDLRFRMTDGAKGVAVHAKSVPPPMFRPGMGVVVEGKLARSGVFESSSIMVKHSNEYRAPHPGEKPEEMYKSLIKGGT
jgi:cytochrome c-type biogenesis protein CcmE